MADGFAGMMLWGNLEQGSIAEEAIDESLARGYIGVYGLGAHILYDRMRLGVDASGFENILGFITGLLAGAPTPGGSRYTEAGKTLLTGRWGDAGSGGVFWAAPEVCGL